MNTAIKRQPEDLARILQGFGESHRPKSYYPEKGKADKIILSAIIKRMTKKNIDSLFLQAAQAESMLGHLRDFKAFIEGNGDFDYDALTRPLKLHPKRRTEFMEEMLTVHKRFLRRMVEFEAVNGTWVQMLNKMTEGVQEDFNELEEKIYEDVLVDYNTKDSRMETFIEPGREVLYGCEDLAASLAAWSKGAIYRSPQKLAAELQERGFENEGRRYYVKLVR